MVNDKTTYLVPFEDFKGGRASGSEGKFFICEFPSLALYLRIKLVHCNRAVTYGHQQVFLPPVSVSLSPYPFSSYLGVVGRKSFPLCVIDRELGK